MSNDRESLPPIRQLPEAEPRVETGPVAFGTDWPGVFIRGDHAGHYAMNLRMIVSRDDLNPILKSTLCSLISDLEASNLVLRHG